MALKVNSEILKTIRYTTGNQCRALSNGVIWQNLLSSNTRRAANDVRANTRSHSFIAKDFRKFRSGQKGRGHRVCRWLWRNTNFSLYLRIFEISIPNLTLEIVLLSSFRNFPINMQPSLRLSVNTPVRGWSFQAKQQSLKNKGTTHML